MAATVERGATPVAATTEESSITVDWDVTTLSTGDPADGYLVRRYDAALPAAPTILAACSGTITESECVESGVPAGEWVYSVTPVFEANWRGAESLMSNPVTTTNADPPVNAITATDTTGGVYKFAETILYRGAAAGSFTLTNAVTDAGSGPASSSTAALAGTTTGWTHTPSTVSTPAGGPYVSNPFSWAAATTSSPTEVVTGRDEGGNGTNTTLTFVDDSTSPTAGSISYPDGYQPDESVAVSFTAGTDAGSGIDTRQLQRASAVLEDGGGVGDCGTFTSFADLGPDSPTSPYVDSQVADGSCYKFRFVVGDRVGNQHIATSANVAVIDLSAGGPRLGTARRFSVLGGTGVASTDATIVSGDLGVSPSSSVTGFPPGIVAGAIHAADSVASEAQADLVAAYTDADGRTPDTEFAGDQNAQTFHPGVHHTAAAFALTGTLTLDGDGDPNSVFIFQVDAALNTAASSHINLIDGATASHVFWQVLGAAGTGANSTFSGTILANGAITLGASAELTGRALSYGVVSLAGNTIRFTAAVPPSVTIDGGPTQVTKDSTPTITGTTTAVPGTAVKVTVTNIDTDQLLTTLAQNDGTWTVTAEALSAGSYEVAASTRDAAGNWGSDTQAVTVEINPDPVDLASAATYSVLAGTGVANVGLTTLAGDLGVSTINTIVGFPPGTLAGTIHNGDTAATDAQADRLAAYTDTNARTPHTEFTGDLNGRTFHAGIHHTSAALALTGTVVLDGEDNPDAVFIFQVDAALNAAASSQVSLINGATADNVYWQVEGAAGTGANSIFAGSILAAGAITLGDSTHLTGSVLTPGTVTLATTTVVFP